MFDPKALDAVVARMERNEAIANTFLTNEQLRAVALELMMKEVYAALRAETPGTSGPSVSVSLAQTTGVGEHE